MRDLQYEMGTAGVSPPPPGLTSTNAPERELLPLRFSIDRRRLGAGDEIEILQVWASSPRLAVGDQVVVRGRYHLQSESDAYICLFVTTNGPARTPVRATQRQRVVNGPGNFELSCEIAAEGRPHVSFYSTTTRSNLGGVYFSVQ